MEAIGHILPFAAAVALSSVPIMATIFILLSPNQKRSSLPFLIGWVIGIFVVVCLAALAAQAVPTAVLPTRPDTVVGGIEIVVGLLLVGLALLTLRHARRQTTHKVPKWLQSAAELGPWKSFGLAFILNVRPKALLLAIAAGLTIRADAQSLTDALVAVAIYTVIAASTVAVPIIATLAAPARWEPRLVRMRGWMIDNGEALGAIIGIVIGVVIIGAGIARL